MVIDEIFFFRNSSASLHLSDTMINLADIQDLFLQECSGLQPKLKAIENYLNSGKVDINESNYPGESALILSLRYQDKYKLTKLLIDYGADVNKPCREHGGTPLHYASSNGYDAIVELLLEHGANMQVQDSVGSSPLALAVWNNHKKVVQILLREGCHLAYCKNSDYLRCYYSFCKAVIEEDAYIVSKMIKYTDDVDFAHARGETPLYFAVCSNNVKIVSLLLNKGAKGIPEGFRGQSPFHLAALSALEDILQVFLEFETDINATNHFGMSAVQLGL